MKNRKEKRTRSAKPLSTLNPPPSTTLGRNATERMTKILQLIGAGTFPNSSTLAKALEVSPKTIKRDFQWMRIHWDAEIIYDQRRFGYYLKKPVDKFPVPTMTEAEMLSLYVAQQASEIYHDSPFHQPLRMVFQKLTRLLDNKQRFSLQDFDGVLSFRPFAPELADLERFETVTRALRHRHQLRFEYRKPGHKESEFRHLDPYHITCHENLWYLIGYDHERSDFRSFVIARICGPILVGDKFQKQHFDIKKYFDKSFAIMKGEGDYQVVIEFDPWATDMLRHRLWHSTQVIKELPGGGGSHLHMRLSGLEEVERWVLSWGTHATVLKPDLLAERVGKIIQQLSQRYPIAAP